MDTGHFGFIPTVNRSGARFRDGEKNSSSRTRTCNLPVNSRPLYQLSYRGIVVIFASPFVQTPRTCRLPVNPPEAEPLYQLSYRGIGLLQTWSAKCPGKLEVR